MNADRKQHRHHQFSSERKTEIVLRALRGESREALAEELSVPVPRVESWEATFVDAGRKALSKRKGRWPHHGKAGGRIAQWSVLLLVLLAVVYFLTRFMQSTGE